MNTNLEVALAFAGVMAIAVGPELMKVSQTVWDNRKLIKMVRLSNPFRVAIKTYSMQRVHG